MKEFNKLSTVIEETQREHLDENLFNKQKYEDQVPLYLKLVVVVTCLFQLISFAFMLREFKRRQNYQQQLEGKVAELNVTNSELEQIAFIASHDLQEPLRKIRTFSDRLMQKYKPLLDEEGQIIVGKITYSAVRMQELIEDLVNYSSIAQADEKLTQVDINDAVQSALSELKGLARKKQATIQPDELPAIDGYEKQIQLLFFHLLENSLKFSKNNVPPVITISAVESNGQELLEEDIHVREKLYYKIVIRDNGIGFDDEFRNKIFIIFQRLHTQNSPYHGKGIGLAICKRIMINHNGYIVAHGEPGVGATFNLYFPKKEQV